MSCGLPLTDSAPAPQGAPAPLRSAEVTAPGWAPVWDPALATWVEPAARLRLDPATDEWVAITQPVGPSVGYLPAVAPRPAPPTAAAVPAVVAKPTAAPSRDGARSGGKPAPPTRYFVAASAGPAADLIAQHLAAAGATITAHSPTLVSGTITSKGKANVLIALLLWFFCVVPMIVYVVSASKDVTRPFTLRIEPGSGGVFAHATGDAQAVAAVVGVLSHLGSAA